ncbi:four-helix bundle copper-binding protein [Mechercharimyces sp. CAU 1602]|uniref:four-helix bundle copper-binding protein n=1 Tax=Mechercharimyces sp. CAU 1602 TaxID=2973933 RepID=UPI00216152DF|nr:four-helix bundle copper-binding protein [Mechercharimyces sp. CAU 1602]MCS1351866.1 four-helix bundle copper-binding protein [Mechercharimyces sp. CAU 1602]
MQPNILHTLQACATKCEHITHMIAHMPDISHRRSQILIVSDCADICTLMVKYVARASFFSHKLAECCAYICGMCAAECMKYPDPDSRHCAAICQQCANECQQYAHYQQ